MAAPAFLQPVPKGPGHQLTELASSSAQLVSTGELAASEAQLAPKGPEPFVDELAASDAQLVSKETVPLVDEPMASHAQLPHGQGVQAEVPAPEPLAAHAVRAAILDRAARIREDRVWFGLFEWLLFCKTVGVRIPILFGTCLFDVCSVCGANVPELRDLKLDKRGLCVVACTSAGFEAHYDAELKFHHDHWAVGYPLSAIDCDGAAVDVPEDGQPRPVQDTTKQAGFRLRETQTDGECGPASMIIIREESPSPDLIGTLRGRLSEEMAKIADDLDWHHAWRACAEHTPQVRPDTDSTSDSESSGSDGDALPAALPAGGASGAQGSGQVGGTGSAHDHLDIASQLLAAKGVRPRRPRAKNDETTVVLPKPPVKKNTPNKDTIQKLSASPGEEVCAFLDAVRECSAKWEGALPDFESWLQTLTPEQREPICNNILNRTAAKRMWMAARKKRQREEPADPLAQPDPRSRPASRRTCYEKKALAERFLKWKAENQSTSRNPRTRVTEFLRHLGQSGTKKELDADRKSLERALEKLAEPGGFSEVMPHGPGRRRRTIAEGRCLNKQRTRLGGSGRHHYAGLLGDELFQWFVDIRQATKCRLTTGHLLAQARRFANQILVASTKLGVHIPIPILDGPAGYGWFRRWCDFYGVYMKQPTARHKCSYEKCCIRLYFMWCNVIRVRALAKATLKRDLDVEGIDQKGIHKNEVGSKNGKTLAFEGMQDVPLNENVAATRDRMSLMTLVRSRVQNYWDIPIEIMFKSTAKTPEAVRLFNGIVVPDDMKVTLVTAPKGSYREEHVLGYLETWLDPWTTERSEANDYP